VPRAMPMRRPSLRSVAATFEYALHMHNAACSSSLIQPKRGVPNRRYAIRWGTRSTTWTPRANGFVTLGMDALGRVLVVVHTQRGERTRLTSARKASRGEADRYHA